MFKKKQPPAEPNLSMLSFTIKGHDTFGGQRWEIRTTVSVDPEWLKKHTAGELTLRVHDVCGQRLGAWLGQPQITGLQTRSKRVNGSLRKNLIFTFMVYSAIEAYGWGANLDDRHEFKPLVSDRMERNRRMANARNLAKEYQDFRTRANAIMDEKKVPELLREDYWAHHFMAENVKKFDELKRIGIVPWMLKVDNAAA